MEIEVSEESIKESKFVEFPQSEGIQLCVHCASWWREGDIPKHNNECKRPPESP